MRGKPTAVLFDLDSTLANTEHRQHIIPLIRNGKATWEDFSARCSQDLPIHGTLTAMREFWPHHEIHIVSGRDASAYPQTVAWFQQHGYPYYDYLQLRGEPNFGRNSDMKIAYVRALQNRGIKPLMFFEDHQPVADAISNATNVPTILVNPGYPHI